MRDSLENGCDGDLEKPKAAQLVEWAIRLHPELARDKPADAVKQVVDLYLWAAKAQSEWDEHERKFRTAERQRRYDSYLVASVDPKLDTFCRWLEKAPNAKDRFKPGTNLIEAITDLTAWGVAKGKTQSGEWIIEKLHTGPNDEWCDEQGEYHEPTLVQLTERQGKDFMRLRTIFREKRSLQDEYASWRESRRRQEKVASARATKTAGK